MSKEPLQPIDKFSRFLLERMEWYEKQSANPALTTIYKQAYQVLVEEDKALLTYYLNLNAFPISYLLENARGVGFTESQIICVSTTNPNFIFEP